MKKVIAKSAKVNVNSCVALLVPTMGIAVGCQKQEKALSFDTQRTHYSIQAKTSTATAASSSVSRQEALNQLDTYFKSLFTPMVSDGSINYCLSLTIEPAYTTGRQKVINLH